jgi:hypothetical protein
MIIGIDFDGTCVSHEFPKIGKDVGAIPVLKKLIEKGHQLILFTMRSDIDDPKQTSSEIIPVGGKYLTEAVGWFKENDIPLYGVQTNPTQKEWTHSPKAYCQLYIDDAGLGMPLMIDLEVSQRPYVDWDMVELMLFNAKVL